MRAVIPVVAGMFSMPQLPFQIANIASAFIWAVWVILWPVLLVAYQGADLRASCASNELIVALVMFALAFANTVPLPFLFVPMLVLFAFVGALHLFAGGSFLRHLPRGRGGRVLRRSHLLPGRRAPSKRSFSERVVRQRQAAARSRACQARARGGASSVITSKFLGMHRALVPLAAGAEGMPLAPFVAASAVSALLWSAVLLLPGSAGALPSPRERQLRRHEPRHDRIHRVVAIELLAADS